MCVIYGYSYMVSNILVLIYGCSYMLVICVPRGFLNDSRMESRVKTAGADAASDSVVEPLSKGCFFVLLPLFFLDFCFLVFFFFLGGLVAAVVFLAAVVLRLTGAVATDVFFRVRLQITDCLCS